MSRGRKARHVGADLDDDAFGTAALDAGDRAQQLNRRRERADLLLDRVREPVDLLVEEVDVREDRADPERVMGVEVTFESAGEPIVDRAIDWAGAMLGREPMLLYSSRRRTKSRPCNRPSEPTRPVFWSSGLWQRSRAGFTSRESAA